METVRCETKQLYVVNKACTVEQLSNSMSDLIYQMESLLKIGVNDDLLEQCNDNAANYLLHIKYLFSQLREIYEQYNLKLAQQNTNSRS